jgi:hypothetical protein
VTPLPAATQGDLGTEDARSRHPRVSVVISSAMAGQRFFRSYERGSDTLFLWPVWIRNVVDGTGSCAVVVNAEGYRLGSSLEPGGPGPGMLARGPFGALEGDGSALCH